jgi:hypothetical protein
MALPDYSKGEKEGMYEDFKGFHARHGTKGKTFHNTSAKSEVLKKKKETKNDKWRSSRTGTHSKSISKKLGIPLHED